MKKIWKYIIMAAAVAIIAPMTACSDDDEVDPYTQNYAYFYQPNSTFAALEYKANGEFLIDVDDPLKVMPVRFTKPAPSDTKVEVWIDPAAVEEYNSTNNSNYVLLSGAKILNPEMLIKQGEYISADSVLVDLGDHKQFQDGSKDYIVPVCIKSAGSAVVSKSSRIFLTFTSTYRANFVSIEESMIVEVDEDEDAWATMYKNQTIDITGLWNADVAIGGNAKIDNSLIDTYNEEHGTSYKALAGTTVTPTFAVSQGSINGTVTVTLGDYSGVMSGEEYLVPVVLSDLTGEGAELATNTCYLVIRKLLVQISTGWYGLSGLTKLAYESTWSASTSWSSGSDDMTTQLQGDQTYLWIYEGDEALVDLGEVKTIRQFYTKYYAWYYAVMTLDNLQTSTDGVTWKDWGNASLGDEQEWYVYWNKAVKFRYIKWTWGAPSYSDDYGSVLYNISFYN